MWLNRVLTVVALLGLLLILRREIKIVIWKDLLTLEVDHRAKDILAVITALLRLAPRDDPARYAKLFAY